MFVDAKKKKMSECTQDDGVSESKLESFSLALSSDSPLLLQQLSRRAGGRREAGVQADAGGRAWRKEGGKEGRRGGKRDARGDKEGGRERNAIKDHPLT